MISSLVDASGRPLLMYANMLYLFCLFKNGGGPCHPVSHDLLKATFARFHGFCHLITLSLKGCVCYMLFIYSLKVSSKTSKISH